MPRPEHCAIQKICYWAHTNKPHDPAYSRPGRGVSLCYNRTRRSELPLPCVLTLYPMRYIPRNKTRYKRYLGHSCGRPQIHSARPVHPPGGHVYVVRPPWPAGSIPAWRAKEKPQASAQGSCGIHLYLFATLKSSINTNTGTARM